MVRVTVTLVAPAEHSGAWPVEHTSKLHRAVREEIVAEGWEYPAYVQLRSHDVSAA